MKRAILKALEVIAIIAGVVFFFAPLHTTIGLVICGVSIAVFLLCVLISSNFDENNTGYWPQRADWTASDGHAETHAVEQHQPK